jgi:putative transposase
MRHITKIRLYPTAEQIVFLDRQFGAVRFVWNKALAIKCHRYRVHRDRLTATHDLKPLLAIAKRSRRYGWLADFDAMALQQTCRNLDRAFINFFKRRAAFPRFKRKAGRQSSYHCTGRIAVGRDRITIPKCPGSIAAVVHRGVVGSLKSITLTKTTTGKYFAACLSEDETMAPAPPGFVTTATVVGVDVGLTHLAVESTGRKTSNPRFVKRAQRNLRRKQKALSRKRKGSKRRARARHLVALAHERLANARNDFQHKLARRLVDENQAIAVETLRIRNMLQNRHLAKAIADASWYALRLKIAYKAANTGRHFVLLDQWAATSKTCWPCRFKMRTLPLSVRKWRCPNCGVVHDRDINAARGVKQLGIEALRTIGVLVSARQGLRKTGDMPAAADEAGNTAAQAAPKPLDLFMGQGHSSLGTSIPS